MNTPYGDLFKFLEILSAPIVKYCEYKFGLINLPLTVPSLRERSKLGKVKLIPLTDLNIN
ncbi:MAG: hypothetical protein B6U69_01125 [Thermofilum sp. ex4484_15]|nr:MAG: hypothetical protein B6U69_01125 [Thermofilum sp. ex4484_15]